MNRPICGVNIHQHTGRGKTVTSRSCERSGYRRLDFRIPFRFSEITRMLLSRVLCRRKEATLEFLVRIQHLSPHDVTRSSSESEARTSVSVIPAVTIRIFTRSSHFSISATRLEPRSSPRSKSRRTTSVGVLQSATIASAAVPHWPITRPKGLHVPVSEFSQSLPLLLWPDPVGSEDTLRRRPAAGLGPTSTAKNP